MSNKIDAIKSVRLYTGLGLKEAKDVVEDITKMPLLDVATVNELIEALRLGGHTDYFCEDAK